MTHRERRCPANEVHVAQVLTITRGWPVGCGMARRLSNIVATSYICCSIFHESERRPAHRERVIGAGRGADDSPSTEAVQ
jgi:hypothetical protein